MERVVWVDGEIAEGEALGGGAFVSARAGRVSVLDRGYQLGEGAFATLRAYDGRCFRAARHLERLRAAGALFGLRVPDAMEGVLDAAAARLAVADARVRVTVTDTTTSVIAEPLRPPSEGEYAAGIGVVTLRGRRVPAACYDAGLKVTSYAPQTLARREAEARGAAEGLQLTLEGDVACATMANIFVVRGKELATPGLDSGCRAGVTREAVLELAARVGLVAAERRISPSELRDGDEAFLTNTRIECLPIASIDGVPLRLGGHATTLRSALRTLIRTELAR